MLGTTEGHIGGGKTWLNDSLQLTGRANMPVKGSIVITDCSATDHLSFSTPENRVVAAF